MNLTTFMPYIWISIAVFSLIIEAATSRMVSIFFLPPAIISLVLSLSNFEIAIQSLIFFVIAALLILLRFTLFRNKFNFKEKKDDEPELLVGRLAIVTETIDNAAKTGKIRIDGKEWLAVSSDSSKIAVGDGVVLVSYKTDEKRFTCKKP